MDDKKALKAAQYIKGYCEKTLCAGCVFKNVEWGLCMLGLTLPIRWRVESAEAIQAFDMTSFDDKGDVEDAQE